MILDVGHLAPKCWEYVEMLTGKTAPKCWPMLIRGVSVKVTKKCSATKEHTACAPTGRRRCSAGSGCATPVRTPNQILTRIARAVTEICVPYWFSGRPAAPRRQTAALLKDGRPHGHRSDGIMLGGRRGIAGKRVSSSPRCVMSLLTEPPRCSPCALQALRQSSE